MNVQLDELHEKARLAIESAERAAEPDLRRAADYLARAAKLGASQRQSGKAVGRSAAWVNMLLKWRDSGYSYSSAFHPLKAEPKCSSDEHQDEESRHPSGTEQTAAETGQAGADQAEPEDDKGKADSQKRESKASKARAEAKKARLVSSTAEADTPDKQAEIFAPILGRKTKNIPNRLREPLVNELGKLGSDQAEERAAAAIRIEELRGRLGMTWHELIVPAETGSEQSKAAR